MSHLLRKISTSVSRSHGSWLTLVLLFTVLVPSICLLWFMNQAVRNESIAIQQKLLDVYHAQLVSAAEQINTRWMARAQRLAQRQARVRPPEFFAELVRSGEADSALIYSTEGTLVYPSSFRRFPLKKTAFSAAMEQIRELERSDKKVAAKAYASVADESSAAPEIARALQAEMRCLFQSGQNAAALNILEGPLQSEKLKNVKDGEGRRLLPNAELMALEFLQPGAQSDTSVILARLERRLNDYSEEILPSSQRRFLMHELLRRFPNACAFPTLEAEDIAANSLEAASGSARDSVLRPANLPGLWQNASETGNVVLFHRTSSLLLRLNSLLADSGFSPEVKAEFVPPGQELRNPLSVVPAGTSFPGWQLALSARAAGTRGKGKVSRTSAYVWIAILMVATVLLLALLAWGLVRRQVALTRLRNDLVANVSHELKTPLASMRLLVDTLLHLPEHNEQTTREYLQLIAKENLRLSRLIENFLTFSRIEGNRYSFDFRPVSVKAVIEQVTSALGDRFQVPKCDFKVQFPQVLPQLMADHDGLVTAINNLLDNAWKYTGEKKEIVFSTTSANGQILFSVRDNGVGISESDKKRIFRRFQQVGGSLSGGRGGFGLGLNIVQFVVDAHGGKIGLISELGRGSTFTISLPENPPAKTEASP